MFGKLVRCAPARENDRCRSAPPTPALSLGGHRNISACAVRTTPEDHPPRAAHTATGGGAAPQDVVGSALSGDPPEVCLDTKVANLALGEDQPPIGENGSYGAARQPPVRRRVAVGISSAHQRLYDEPHSAAAIRWTCPGYRASIARTAVRRPARPSAP